MGRLNSLFKRGAVPKVLKSTRRPRKRQPSQLAFSANYRASTASSILQSLLTLYALVAVMHGVVIPISDALARPVEHAAYRQVFYIFMHGVGILCLVYLNSLISWHNRLNRLSALRSSSFSDNQKRRKLGTIEIPICQVNSHIRSDGEQLPDGHNDKDCNKDLHSEIPLATEEASESDSGAAGGAANSHAAAKLPGLAAPFRDDELELQPLTLSGAEKQKQKQSKTRKRLMRNPLVTNLLPILTGDSADCSQQNPGDLAPQTPDSPYTPGAFTVSPITQSETGVNLYLRLGAIVFGFGVMIHDGFKISEVIERQGAIACHDIWFIPKQVIHLIFIMAQTYYLFKHHRVTFNTQLPIIRFMMVHLIVTNLCIWVKTVIYEIKVGLTAESHSESKSIANSSQLLILPDAVNKTDMRSSLPHCLERLLDEGPSYKLGPYLYPCAVEYGLICAAICFKMFSTIGDTKVTPYGRKMYPEGPRFTACHKSHRGLFLGLFIMICILVPMISLQLLKTVDIDYRGLYMLVVLGIECAVLLFTSVMAVLGTSRTTRQLKLYKVRGNETFDVNLLFVGLAGIMCYNLFVSISVGSCALDSSDAGNCPRWTGHKNLITKAGGLKALLEVFQSLVQTLFIMQGIQRRITLDLVNRNHKPGRGITIGLLIANLAMWIEAVLEAKRSFAEDFPKEYFGNLAWSIVKYIFLPLIIFYRFHSSVCLSEIWIHSYKMPKKHATTGAAVSH